jgi:hypothetical protein
MIFKQLAAACMKPVRSSRAEPAASCQAGVYSESVWLLIYCPLGPPLLHQGACNYGDFLRQFSIG